MQNKYFNENEFQYSLDYIDKDPFIAKELFDEYLKKYPKDYYAKAYYISLLETINQFEEANKIFREVSNESAHDYSFAMSNKRKIGFQCIMALNKARLLANKERYEDLLDYYYRNIHLFDNRGDTQYLIYFCRAKIGAIKDSNTLVGPYRFLQVVHYDENRFFEHITKHQANYNIDVETPNDSIFVPDFPIQEVVNEVKKILPSDKKLCLGLFDESYYFKYDNCGRIKGKMTNYFKVTCFHNTTEFITMCPIINAPSRLIHDFNNLQQEETEKKEEEIKVKMLSPIDKFNMRYRRK